MYYFNIIFWLGRQLDTEKRNIQSESETSLSKEFHISHFSQLASEYVALKKHCCQSTLIIIYSSFIKMQIPEQGKFIYIAHFIPGGNSKCFTECTGNHKKRIKTGILKHTQ